MMLGPKPMSNSIKALLCVFIIACNMPKADLTISKMEQYWQYYRVENYDSLRAFYIPKGDNPNERLNSLFNALHNLHENYGSVRSVNLVEKSTSKSIDKGDRIELKYEVEFDKKFINNQFSFAKDENGKFKIIDHSFSQ